jgi:hypothetical protein
MNIRLPSSMEGGAGSWVGHIPQKHKLLSWRTCQELCRREWNKVWRPIQGNCGAMKNTLISMSPLLYFSYNQFMIFDASERLPGCVWTDKHVAQGFARRESTVNVGTLLEFGQAAISMAIGQYLPQEKYERVIAVPFECTSGTICIEGPEETEVERSHGLSVGHYRLVIAQSITGSDNELVDIYFEPRSTPTFLSEILVLDQMIDPPDQLVETAAIAGK